jgi:lysine 2,3-aminomutase
LKPTKKRWDECFQYIENTPGLVDIVVSGGDCFYLEPQQLYDIGKRLIKIPHIRRFRYASKGLAVCPSRFLAEDDQWTEAMIAVSDMAKTAGKVSLSSALHLNEHVVSAHLTNLY